MRRSEKEIVNQSQIEAIIKRAFVCRVPCVMMACPTSYR